MKVARRKWLVAAGMLVLGLHAACMADTVVLNDGTRIDGEVMQIGTQLWVAATAGEKAVVVNAADVKDWVKAAPKSSTPSSPATPVVRTPPVNGFPIPANAAGISITGAAQPGLEPLDRVMVEFLAQHHGVGGALAVTRNGRLVYARGFGLADREAREPVQPNSMFRIASLSKSITSATIMRLVENRKIRLEDPAFSFLALAPLKQPGFKPDERLGAITILELLQHRGGFDRDKSLDPMFQSVKFAGVCGASPPVMPPDIIRIMEGRPLDFAPGERFAYANFDYCVLGRIIERVTGESYGDAVRRLVFAPLGIERIQLGHMLLTQRARGEVKYYTAKNDVRGSAFAPLGPPVPTPYGLWSLEAMDSCGGWIASAPDLVKFASALDDRQNGLLTAASLDATFARPPGAAGLKDNKPGGEPATEWYGCGWDVKTFSNGRTTTWHTGHLDGTGTLLVRRWDGLDWAVLLNQDNDESGERLTQLLDPLIHAAVSQVGEWPKGLARNESWAF